MTLMRKTKAASRTRSRRIDGIGAANPPDRSQPGGIGRRPRKLRRPRLRTQAARTAKLILAAMIFAVSMTFIDQTIVAISIPRIQDDVGLSSTGVKWVVNGYLLSLSALFAFGGRIADMPAPQDGDARRAHLRHRLRPLRRHPEGRLAEAWLIIFRVIQGVGAAIMFPAALAIVLVSFPIVERGKAMAIFFGITGALTSIGPIAGGYLTEWTWRAIFWINIPVAIIALFLIWKAKRRERHPDKLDYRGTVLVSGGMGLRCSASAVGGLGLGPVKTWARSDRRRVLVCVRDRAGVENPLLGCGSSRTALSRSTALVLFLLMIPSCRCSSSPASTPRSRSGKRPRKPASTC